MAERDETSGSPRFIWPSSGRRTGADAGPPQPPAGAGSRDKRRRPLASVFRSAEIPPRPASAPAGKPQLAPELGKHGSDSATSGPPTFPPAQKHFRRLNRGAVDRSTAERTTRSAGQPGVALLDGEAVATWRAQKSGRRLAVTVHPFRRLPARSRAGFDQEVQQLARVRGCAGGEIRYMPTRVA